MTSTNHNHRADVVIRFAGEGGQGLVTSADTLGRAAAAAGYHIQTFSTFPSQIIGGPASSQVRISVAPVLSGGDRLNTLVALNSEAYELHVKDVLPDGIVIYDSGEFEPDSDITSFGINATYIAKHVGNPRAANMALIGAVAQAIGFPLNEMAEYVRQRFTRGRANDEAIITANQKALQLGAEKVATSDFAPRLLTPPTSPLPNQAIMTGNAAISLGAMAAGLNFYVGYPISPATTILVWMKNNLVGDGRFAYQTSSEIESINALLGAGFAGKKAMTATAGPGLSLMSEGIGLAWMAELPCVIVDVQRGGPATGLPTKSEQSDLFTCMYPAHGDIKLPILAPGTVEECFYTAALSVNWAERYQGPVILMSEFAQAERAQNIPMPDLARVQLEERTVYHGKEGYQRYESWNGTGLVPPMPLPGGNGAYVANGSEHDEIGDTTHLPKHHVRLTERRFAKLSVLNDAPYELENTDAEVGFMPWGSSKGPAREAYNNLRAKGVDLAWVYSVALSPLPEAVLEVLRTKKTVLVPELNYQGQWATILRQHGVNAQAITQYTGLPFNSSTLEDSIVARLPELQIDT